MVKSGRDRATVQAINDIGHILGVATIAEWVEDEQTLCALNTLGVDYAQGGSGTTTDAIEAVNYSVLMGARVSSNSNPAVGTISSAGLFRAGRTTGTTTVIATDADGHVGQSGTITVICR